MSYSTNFLEGYSVSNPQLDSAEKKKFLKNNLELSDYYLDYQNYSVLQNPFRKLPYYSACNIDGVLFKKVERKDNWKLEKKIPRTNQFGPELYELGKGKLDRGHLTKREDVQWGNDENLAKEAADSTFYYTNAVPQHKRLNRTIWKNIENYILHSETISQKLRVSVFTGPVLSENDPILSSLKLGMIQIPTLFWKVVFYESDDQTLHRVAFFTNQSNLLKRDRIIKPTVRKKDERRDLFMKFKQAETYQTNVAFIEKLTKMKFYEAKEKYLEDRPSKLILEKTNVRNKSKGNEQFERPKVELKNLIL